jgi:hypothetical protein
MRHTCPRASLFVYYTWNMPFVQDNATPHTVAQGERDEIGILIARRFYKFRRCY